MVTVVGDSGWWMTASTHRPLCEIMFTFVDTQILTSAQRRADDPLPSPLHTLASFHTQLPQTVCSSPNSSFQPPPSLDLALFPQRALVCETSVDRFFVLFSRAVLMMFCHFALAVLLCFLSSALGIRFPFLSFIRPALADSGKGLQSRHLRMGR